MRSIAIKLILLFIFHFSNAQDSPYWVYLERDADPELVAKSMMMEHNFKYLGYSQWLHALSVIGNDLVIQGLNPRGVKDIARQAYFYSLSKSDKDPVNGFALEQIGGELMVESGLDGKGIAIGIIDGGFLNAPTDPALVKIFNEGRVKGYRDFISPEMVPYGGTKALDDRHGTDVMQLVGGLNELTNVRHGLATGASFFLARTDHGASEKKIEEFYLIKALEWLDSLDVKLVNISLGYTTGFDVAEDNYQPNQMDGTSAVARAVQIAATEKGMLIVVSAGNDGDKEWRVISTPADARGAVTVGATKYKYWDKANFSSVGPDYISYLKPDVSCFASEGTSFSAPIITGLAAALWQKVPHFTNTQIRDMIVEAGHLYPYGNNYIGYGVPLAKNILARLAGAELPTRKEVKVYGNTHRMDQKAEQHVVLYHKADAIRVVKTEYLPTINQKIRITRADGAQFTTVVVDNVAKYEIRWMTVN